MFLRCAQCESMLRVPNEHIGKQARCPKCGYVQHVAAPLPPFRSVGRIPAAARRAGDPITFRDGAKQWFNIGLWLALLFIAMFALLAALSAPGSRGPTTRTVCQNNLKQIIISLENYWGQFGRFPESGTGQDNEYPVSWRVRILALTENENLHDAYDFSAPWDSSSNRAVVQRHVALYSCPLLVSSNRTSYLALTGPGTAMGGDGQGNPSRLSDGASQTIVLVEISDFSVPWAQPRDITIDEFLSWYQDPRKRTSTRHAGGVPVAFADGHVSFLPFGLDEATVRALCTSDGGDVANADW